MNNGYNWHYNMSHNALDAYDRGLLPASKIAGRLGKGVTAADVAAVLTPVEWHHTSPAFNVTYFYRFPSEDEIARIRERVERRKHWEVIPLVTRVTMYTWEPDVGRNNKKIWRRRSVELGVCKVYERDYDFLLVETEDGRRIRRKRRRFKLEDPEDLE